MPHDVADHPHESEAEGHHGHSHVEAFDGMSPGYARALWAVIVINGVMFGVEVWAGALAGSQALWADALDFLADTLTYALSFAVIGRPVRVRSMAALAKGASLAVMGAWVLGSTIWAMFSPHLPQAEIMGVVGLLALAANVASVLILVRYAQGDANVRSVWLCSRNDAIGNVIIVGAAVTVGLSGNGWPDLIVAAIMSGLFLSSAWQIIRQAMAERARAEPAP